MLDYVRMMEVEYWVEGSEFVESHVTMLVSFSGTGHDMDVVVEALKGVFFVEREFLAVCPVLDESAVGHLRIAHRWPIQEPV